MVFALAAWPASAALREVAVGNFYFNDATAGDGIVEATQGDQLRLTVYDGGPGTPPTVDVDALGIHSGSLASGETFTTPPLDKPGTYTLYCKPHVNRGHTATLIVRASATVTTKPATTVPPTTPAPVIGAPAGRATTTAPTTTAPWAPPAEPPRRRSPWGVVRARPLLAAAVRARRPRHWPPWAGRSGPRGAGRAPRRPR